MLSQYKDSGLPSNGKLTTYFSLLVFLVAFAVFANTLFMGFSNDDTNTIVSNYALRDIGNIPALFTSGMWPAGSAPEITYRPLFMASLALNYAIWGLSPFGYHLTGVLLHALASVLVFLVARKIVGKEGPALFASLLFAVHPIHTEVVAWVSAYCGSMAAVFMFAAFLLYLQFKEKGQVPLLLASLFLYLLSVFSKETAITFPAVILASELVLSREAWNRRLLTVLPYALVAGGYFAIRSLVLGGFHADALPLVSRLMTGPGILLRYLNNFFFPFDLKVFYDIPIRERLLDWGVLAPSLGLLLLLVLFLLSFRFEKKIFLGLSWAVITISPFSGILLFPRPALMADRYLYLPSLGLCLVAGVAVHHLFKGEGGGGKQIKGIPVRLWTCGLVVLILALFSVLTVQRNTVWSDDVSFFSEYVDDAPNIPQGHNGMAVNYFRQGDYAKAAEAFERAIALENSYYDAHYNLGVTYLNMGRPEQARSQFLRTLKINPNFPDALDQLGQLQLKAYEYDAAIESFRRAVRVDPKNPRYRRSLNLALALKGRRETAR